MLIGSYWVRSTVLEIATSHFLYMIATGNHIYPNRFAMLLAMTVFVDGLLRRLLLLCKTIITSTRRKPHGRKIHRRF